MKWLVLALLLVINLAAAAGAAAQETATPTPTPTTTPTPTPTPIRETLIPIGTIQMFAGNTPPPGWLWCNGSAIGRTDYPQLFAVIGTTFGAGDGVSTFNLPNCSGRVPVAAGWGTGLTPRNLADMWGAETHTLTIAQLPPHDHIQRGNMLGTLYHGAFGGSGTRNTLQQTTISAFSGSFLTTDVTGSGQPHNIMQPSIALGFIIWTGAVALELPGGGGGYEQMITPTPAPQIMYYATVQVGEQTANTAFAMSVTAGEFAITIFLAGIFGLLLIQMVMKAREGR